MDKVDSRKYEDRVDKDFPLFTKILNWAAEAMLSRILGALGLDSDAASIFWSAINIIWLKFVEIVEPNNYARRIQIAYKARLEEAIRQYTRNGKTALLEKLAKDMAGIK